MKCPKCHYLSFDPEPRCRNCGYDLELTDDLALKTAADAVAGPMADLTLREPDAARRAPITLELVQASRPAAASGADRRGGAVAVAVDDSRERPPAPAPAPSPRPTVSASAAAAAPAAPAAAVVPQPAEPAPRRDVAAGPDPTRTSSPAASGPSASRDTKRAPSTTSELPLFVQGLAGRDRGNAERSMPAAPSAPRPPLSVRRGSPDPPRPRQRQVAAETMERKLGPFDRDLLDDLRRVERGERERAHAAAEHAPAARSIGSAVAEAGIGVRLAAAGIDALLLGGIGVVVILATLRVCGLGVSQVSVLPMLPIAAFLLLVTFGYLLMFTIASGQTVGKMAMGIRVVGAASRDGRPVLTIRQAAYRELVSVPLVIAFGAAFVPAVLGRGPAVHDRLAETRVVRG